ELSHKSAPCALHEFLSFRLGFTLLQEQSSSLLISFPSRTRRRLASRTQPRIPSPHIPAPAESQIHLFLTTVWDCCFFRKVSIMFPQPSSSIYQSSTCFVTYGTMGHVDPKQPPQRSKPWTTVAARDFIHKVDLIVPQECHAVLHQKLVEQRQQPCYARVTMTLGQVLEGDFFSEYIKNGTKSHPRALLKPTVRY
ncbi:Ribonuclease P protein subunit p40, partial [Tolypocladium paradoxum]